MANEIQTVVLSVAVADIAGGSSTRAKVSLSYVQGKNQ